MDGLVLPYEQLSLAFEKSKKEMRCGVFFMKLWLLHQLKTPGISWTMVRCLLFTSKKFFLIVSRTIIACVCCWIIPCPLFTVLVSRKLFNAVLVTFCLCCVKYKLSHRFSKWGPGRPKGLKSGVWGPPHYKHIQKIKSDGLFENMSSVKQQYSTSPLAICCFVFLST